jgi:transcriptional regulator with XRE-family HTH domain
VTDESFGRRLRRERERRQIALSSISANTKISATLFQALERDDISRWPGGIFRRAFIRAYAEGVGLDPDEVMREFLERFPDPTAPPASAPGAAPSEATSTGGAVSHRRAALRLTLADSGGLFARGRVLPDMRRRLAAVVCDAAVVMGIAVSVFLVSGDFWTPLAMTALIYYSAGILLLGDSPGVSLCAQARHRSDPGSATASVSGDLVAWAFSFVGRLNRTDWTRAVWRTFRSHG